MLAAITHSAISHLLTDRAMIHKYKVYIIINSELLSMMIKEEEIGIHPLFSIKDKIHPTISTSTRWIYTAKGIHE
jgi:hypothetical protein